MIGVYRRKNNLIYHNELVVSVDKAFWRIENRTFIEKEEDSLYIRVLEDVDGGG
jgi:hypothetical protein